MDKTEETGWVMVYRDTGIILEFTFSSTRRDSIYYVERLYPKRSRRSILRQWKPTKARRTIELEDAVFRSAK